MGFCVCPGNMMTCSMGTVPTSLIPKPKKVFGPTGFMANCSDSAPFINIPTFATCRSLLNPTTAALTVAAAGVLTPGPCTPVPVGIWLPTKPNVLCENIPVLVNNSLIFCSFAGVIKYSTAGQFKVMT